MVCKAALQGMVLLGGLSIGRVVADLGGGSYTPHLLWGWERLSYPPLPVCVSHVILAHRWVPPRSGADGGGDAASRTAAHGGSAPLREIPARQGSPGTSGDCCRVSQTLPDIKDGFSPWLGRLTAQWSVEDEEEAARERRRREREKQLRSQAEEGLNGTIPCSESAGQAQENQ